jgi:hypothetical protein
MAVRTNCFSAGAASALCCALLSASTFGTAADSPAGLRATAKLVPPQNPADEIKALRHQLSLLTDRVTELEKPKADVPKDDIEADTRFKRLEQQVASLELAEQKNAAAAKTAKSEDGAQPTPSSFVAPFVIHDEEGHTIFRVDIAPGRDLPRIMIGNALKAHIEMGPTTAGDGGSALILYDKNGSGRVGMASHSHSYLQIVNPDHHSLRLGSSEDDRFGIVVARDTINSATLTSTSSGAGYLGLTNQTGAIVAEGAAKTNGVGIFRTGPKCCIPPGAIGPHEYIVGAQ